MPAMAGMAVLGFSLAPIYPGMMTQTPLRLGRLSDHAVGFQVGAAMLGAVSIPGLGGILLEKFGIAWLNGMVAVLAVSLALILGGLVWSAGRGRAADAVV